MRVAVGWAMRGKKGDDRSFLRQLQEDERMEREHTEAQKGENDNGL